MVPLSFRRASVKYWVHEYCIVYKASCNVSICTMVFYYASAFRRRRHYVFGLPVHPSVRPKPEITSFHLYMGPLVHLTNRDRFAACPSVRPSGEVSGNLPENAWREWSEILHVDVSWTPSELIRLWSWSVDFPPFGVTLAWWNGSNFGFPGISQRTHGGNGLKVCMLMYLDHLQNWLVYGHTLLIFLILAGFFTYWNGSNLGFPGISWRALWGNGLKFSMLMYLEHLKNWLDYGHSLLIFLILALFWLSETGQIWGFWAFSRERMEGMAWNFASGCILTTFRTD